MTLNILFLPYKRGNRIYAIIYSLIALFFFVSALEEVLAGTPIFNSWGVAFALLFTFLAIMCWRKPNEGSYSFKKDKLDIKNFLRSLFLLPPLSEK